MTKQLKLAEYDTLEALDYDIDVLEKFYEYDSGYICDNIGEIADNFIPVYTHELWEGVPKIKEYIEEAIAQGLCETPRGENPDLDKFYIAGYYQYFTQLLYNNETELYYNYIAREVNNWIDTLNYDQKEKLDIDVLSERIEEERADIDNNSEMEELLQATKRIIAEFKGKVNKDTSWINTGDLDFMAYGSLFIKRDSDLPLDKCYHIVNLINMPWSCGIDGYMIEIGYVDINDSWIDWEAVDSSCDITDDDCVKVSNLLSYYGITEFGGETYKYDEELEVLEHLAGLGICKD